MRSPRSHTALHDSAAPARGTAKQARRVVVTARQPRRRVLWSVWLAVLGLAILLCIVYEPAMHGPLVFDDYVLPYGEPQLRDAPLRVWLSGVRPILMFTYWVNYRFSGIETFGYHLSNVLLHAANGLLVFFLLRLLLRGRALLSGFGTAIFLLHPLQTESVGYLAGRSELLTAFFTLASLLVFLRGGPATWKRALVLLVLVGAAIFSKEQALALIPLFILLESGWRECSPELLGGVKSGTRRNWRIWTLLLVAGSLGAAFVWEVLKHSRSAGFGLPNEPAPVYFLTQCYVIFKYIGLFLLPVGQNIDHHVPLAHTPFEHGSLFGLAALVLLTWLCWRYRRRAPLATFGFLMFLILIAPTSSFVPLADAMAEHRMYLPVLGLILIVLAGLQRVRVEQTRPVVAMGCVVIALGVVTAHRSRVWGSITALADDAVAQPPLTTRSFKMLAWAYMGGNRCAEFFERLAPGPPKQLYKDPYVLLEWGLANACVGRNAEAVATLQKSMALRPGGFGFAMLGLLEGKLGRTMQSLADLNRAIELEPNFDLAYYFRGLWYLAANQLPKAAADFRRALAINPLNTEARRSLEAMQPEAPAP